MQFFTITIIFVILISLCNARYWPLKCRRCSRAVSIEDCSSWVECSQDEECYMDELITTQLTLVYEGGCRAKDVCGASSSSSGRRNLADDNFNVREFAHLNPRAIGDFTACSRCCSGEDFCNGFLCGIKRVNNRTMCNSCGDHQELDGDRTQPVRYPEDCAHRVVCRSDQMCYASTHTHGENELQHQTQCMDAKVCRNLMSLIFSTYGVAPVATFPPSSAAEPSLVGKRNGDNTICAVCCGDDECNIYACQTIKSRMERLLEDSRLDKWSLKEKF